MIGQLEYATASDGVRLALHRLPGGAGRPPLLLVHGAFCNHRLWLGEDGEDYLARLAEAGVPLLAVAGAGDLLAPPAAVADLAARFGSADSTLLVAGTAGGWSADLSHAALVVGAAARDEMLPALLHWLNGRTTRPSVSVCTPPAAALS